MNLDKKEFVNPHRLGTGFKLWEQLANHPGTGSALIILCAAHREQRGGGDLDLSKNWHGPERKFPENNTSPGPMPTGYNAIAHRTIGRWAGDRIALVGDYAEDSDLPKRFKCSMIYKDITADRYKDISDDVCAVIEHELQGKFEGGGWRAWKEKS